MKRSAAAFSLAVALSTAAAGDPASPPPDPRQQALDEARREAAARIDAAPARGVLQRVERAGRTGYLFGVIHVGHARFFPLDRATTEALRDSREFWFEVDPRRLDEVGTAFTRDRARIANPPSAATLARLAGARRELGLPAQASGRLDALGESLRLSYDYAATLGLDASAAPERYVLGFARNASLPVRAFETPDEHVAVLAGLSGDGDAMLEDAIEGARSGRVARDVSAQVDAWEAADEAALDRLQRAALDPSRSAAVARVHERLLCDRNRRWLDTLAESVDQGRRPFIAVGVFHLVGRCSLAELLRDRGFQVTRVKGGPSGIVGRP